MQPSRHGDVSNGAQHFGAVAFHFRQPFDIRMLCDEILQRMGSTISRPFDFLYHGIVNLNCSRSFSELQNIGNIQIVDDTLTSIPTPLIHLPNLLESRNAEYRLQIIIRQSRPDRVKRKPLYRLQQHVKRQFNEMVIEVRVMYIPVNLSWPEHECELPLFKDF
jgi:hypothetical protein